MAYLLQHLLSESARRAPERPAIVFGGRTISYGELDLATNAFAELLLELGVAKGARIGVHLGRGPEALVAMIGALKAGAIYVPLDRQSPRGRLRYIVDACRIELIATDRSGGSVVAEALDDAASVRHVVTMDGADLPALPDTVQAVDWTAVARTPPVGGGLPAAIDTDAAYILFTSGSTGVPKGVAISHRNVLTFVDSMLAHFDITADDRVSHVCPLHSDMSVIDIYVALGAGACIVGVPEMHAMFPVKLAQAVADGGITVWNSVPSALVGLANLGDLEHHDLSSLRLVLFAGEVFPLEPLRRLMAAVPGARFCNMYGQTEANSSTYHWVEAIPEGSRDPIPIGRALPDFEVFALDDDGRRIAAPGEEGELYVRASTVALGYWQDPERSGRSFVPNPLAPGSSERVYRTGDIVRLDAGGEFVFVGRRDQMVKSRGYRIEIGEVEAALARHPAIRSAAVIAIPDERIGNRLAAFIEPARAAALTRDEVVAHCLTELPRYMVPEEIAFLDALPLTPSGKIDRQRLART